VWLFLTNGDVLDSGPVALPPGHFKRPASAAALRRKFDECTAGRLAGSAAAQLFEACQRIDRLRGIDDLLPSALPLAGAA
jgi:hypothetical protein